MNKQKALEGEVQLGKVQRAIFTYLFYIKSKCEDDLKPKERQTAICLNEEDLHLIDKHNEIFALGETKHLH